jgi:hypothetical protein
MNLWLSSLSKGDNMMKTLKYNGLDEPAWDKW